VLLLSACSLLQAAVAAVEMLQAVVVQVVCMPIQTFQ
jgi:hypothetical protein